MISWSTPCVMKGSFIALGSCGPISGAKLSAFCITILFRAFSLYALWLGVLWHFVWHTNFDGLNFDFGNRCLHFLFRKFCARPVGCGRERTILPARWVAGRRVKFRSRKLWKPGIVGHVLPTVGFDFNRVLRPLSKHCICPFADSPSNAKPWTHIAFDACQIPKFCFPVHPGFVTRLIPAVSKQLRNVTTTGLRGGAAAAAATKRKHGEKVSEAELLNGLQELLARAVPQRKPS